MSDQLIPLFKRLRAILEPYQTKMLVSRDNHNSYYLNTPYIMKNGKPLFFAAVEIKKRYVAYHLMPIYIQPELNQALSPTLLTRKHGKSCFNFTNMNDELYCDLERISQLGFQYYLQQGYLSAK